MRQRTAFVPDVMPHLSAGRHRNPRRGACFMEFASYLAGERWSDHPSCTDPMLASLARGVNDLVSDERRDELTRLIPRVVGLAGPRSLGAVVALRAAIEALPIASMERQRVLAVGILTLAASLETASVPSQRLRADAQASLELAPDAARWARDRIRMVHGGPFDAVREELVVATAVVGVARACVDDPDTHLIRMLSRAVDDVEALVRPTVVAESSPQPARV